MAPVRSWTDTPVSLSDRLKVAKPDAAEWRRLQAIYHAMADRRKACQVELAG